MIIKSLLDTDMYKLTMLQIIWKHYRDIPVEFALINRSNTDLGKRMDVGELRVQLQNIALLHFTEWDIEYLGSIVAGGRKVFDPEFLDALKTYKFSSFKLTSDFELTFTGSWYETTLWETFALSIINELWSGPNYEGISRLTHKINLLSGSCPTIVEFGTRRRHSGLWHQYVIEYLVKHYLQGLKGTSNLYYAQMYGLQPMGTMAHELFMVRAAHEWAKSHDVEKMRDTHREILDLWYYEYGSPMSLMLTDTFGSDFFFKDTTPMQAYAWKGLRQDSGSPFTFTNKALELYRTRNVNPKDKIIVYSDGLTADSILAVQEYTGNRINTCFGWGTNLTNDVGETPPSLVIKATKAQGESTIKLSDTPGKTTGDTDLVEFYRKVFA